MTRILQDFLRDDAGTPLGRGMPSGRPLRADGQSHYDAWLALVRRDPCVFCLGPAGTVDHIEPRSQPARGIGSVHGWINTAGACAACNGSTRDRPLLRFMHQRKWANRRARPREREASGVAGYGWFCQPRWNQIARSCQSCAMRTPPAATRAMAAGGTCRAARVAPAAARTAPVAP